MSKFYLFLLLFIASFLFSQKHSKTNSGFNFYENRGQIIDQNGKQNTGIKFLFNSPGLNVQIKKSGFSYDVYEVQRKEIKRKSKADKVISHKYNKNAYSLTRKFHRVDIDFVNANKNPEITGEIKSDDYDNYYNLPENTKGVEKVHRYKKITYKNIYQNIDVVFFKPDDSTKAIEYNFIINPGGKISDIKLKFNGAKTKLKDGKLSMNLRFGEMQEKIPYSWEESGNSKYSLNVEFKDLGNQVFGFSSEKDISDKVIVIDPVPTRIWGSYLGGDGEEDGEMKVDRNNNVYIFGFSDSTNNIATSGAYQTNLADYGDAFIVKVSKDGQRFWGTYYGKKYFDITGSIDTDQDLNIYAAILSEKPNPAYPTNPYYFYPKIVFVKLDLNGSMIINKEFGPETGNPYYLDYNDEIIINDLRYFNQKVYVVGEIRIPGFGTAGTFQENIVGGSSGFFTKFDSTNGNQDYFTYVGGNSATMLFSIFNSDSSGLEITGVTTSTNFPMINAFQSTNQGVTNGNNNGLYLKFSHDGNLVKSSYFGKDQSYLFTSTRRFGNEIVFAGKMWTSLKVCYFLVDTSLNSIKDYKEVGVFNNYGYVYVDSQRNLYVTGLASPHDPWVNQVTTPDAYLPSIGQYISIFLTKYDSNLQKIWSTFYQGNGGTQLGAVIKDYNDHLYLWGMSSNNTTGIATAGTFQQTGGHPSNDLFIAKFSDCNASNLTTNSPVCPGSTITLQASGGTNYSWSGPNGWTSNLQNPTILNATVANNGIYTCVVTGGTCDGTFTVEVRVEDKSAPVPDVATLPTITGNCKTVISTFPTATDACKGKITATTSSPLQYSVPGNYQIIWNYNDGSGNISTQTQNVVITSEPLPTATSPQIFCKINQPKVSDLQIVGTSVKWYDAAGNLLNTNTLLTDGTKYFATQTLNGCESSKLEVKVTINDSNPPTGNANQDFCSAQNPKISDIVVNGQNIKWYDNLGNILPVSTLLVDGKTYYASQNLNGCESTQKLAVTVSVKTGGVPANDYTTELCNDSTANTKTENLNNYKGNITANTAGLTFDFYTSTNSFINDPSSVTLNLGQNIFNVKVSNSLGCFVWIKLTLSLNEKPKINLPPNAEYCEGKSIDLNPGDCIDCSFSWTKDGSTTPFHNQQILTVSSAGTYTVKVKTQKGCENTATVIVKKSITATILRVEIVNNSATIILSQSGDFLYSLDNVTFQNSNIFTNLPNGNHTAYVKTKGGCIIGTIKFSIFLVSNAFSPNGDGINDTWKIDGIENYPNSEIKVLDRFGNPVLNHVTNGIFEWDGKSNSRNLPTGSYWYDIKVSDGRILQGWLLLKNRN